jgi:hypothetical protein
MCVGFDNGSGLKMQESNSRLANLIMSGTCCKFDGKFSIYTISAGMHLQDWYNSGATSENHKFE